MEIFFNITFLFLQIFSVGFQAATLPGYILQFITVFLWFILFDKFNLMTVCFLFVFMFITSFIDNIANLLGAKKFGASKWGIAGAFLGGILSLISGLFWGILILPFLAAFAFEILFDKKDLKKAFKAGLGTFAGFITGYFLKLAITISIAVWGILMVF